MSASTSVGAVGIAIILMAIVPLGGSEATVTTTAPVPDADVWRTAAATGAPVPIEWNGHTYMVEVAPNDLVDPSGYPVVEVDGVLRATDDVMALTGTVVGQPESTVRITLDGERIDGMLLGVDGQHLGFSTADGVTTVARPSDAFADLPLQLRQIDDETMPGQEIGGGCGVSIGTMGSPFGLISGWPERTLDVAFAVDDMYADNVPGGDWLAATVALANRLDGFYSHENDIRVSPVHMIRVSQDIFNAPTTNQALADIAQYYDAHHEETYREIVYLVSGVDYTNALGQVSCIGGVGYGNSHYATGFMLLEETYGGNIFFFSIYADSALKTAAHEIGHQLGARHEQHNCVEVAESYTIGRAVDACTTMAPFVDFHGIGFSTWSLLTARGLADQRQI